MGQVWWGFLSNFLSSDLFLCSQALRTKVQSQMIGRLLLIYSFFLIFWSVQYHEYRLSFFFVWLLIVRFVLMFSSNENKSSVLDDWKDLFNILRLLHFLISSISCFRSWNRIGVQSTMFLSDPGKPGVRSLCPNVRQWVSESVRPTPCETLLMWLWLMKIPSQN